MVAYHITAFTKTAPTVLFLDDRLDVRSCHFLGTTLLRSYLVAVLVTYHSGIISVIRYSTHKVLLNENETNTEPETLQYSLACCSNLKKGQHEMQG